MPILNTKNEKKTSGNRGCMVTICHPQNITKTRSDYHQLKPFKGDGESTPEVHIANPEKRKDSDFSANVKKKICFHSQLMSVLVLHMHYRPW